VSTNNRSNMKNAGDDSTDVTQVPLLRSAGTSMWELVRADLLTRIEQGEQGPGDRIATESALANRYGVNRITVRRALAELARAGIVRTEHGIGSFVAPRVMRHRIDDGEISLLESMKLRGHRVSQNLIEVIEHKAGSQGHDALAREAGIGLAEPSELWTFPDFTGPLVEYRYVLVLDDVPWSTSFVVVPKSLVPATWTSAQSIFATVAEDHQLKLRRDQRRFSAILSDGRDASLLDVPIGAPLLLLSGTNVDQGDRIIAYIVHHIRGDRAEYAVRLPKNPAS
jgi:DNA-binding GntR family transcriptional regulator